MRCLHGNPKCYALHKLPSQEPKIFEPICCCHSSPKSFVALTATPIAIYGLLSQQAESCYHSNPSLSHSMSLDNMHFWLAGVQYLNEVYLWYLLAVQKIHQVDSRVKQTCLTTIQAPGLGKNTDGTLLQDQKKILGIEIAYIVHSIVYILYIYIHIIEWNRRKHVHKMFMTSWWAHDPTGSGQQKMENMFSKTNVNWIKCCLRKF